MTTEELIREVQDLKRRVDFAETRLGQIDGKFEFITGQLRDIQLYMHAKFGEVDKRLDRLEAGQQRLEAGQARLEADVRSLRSDLPGMMRDVMREVLAEKR